jgi:hypothetical protein
VNGRVTTTVQVLRGTTVDTYGDDADSGTVVASAIPVSIVEGRPAATTPESTHPRVLRSYIGRTRGDRDIRAGDQLQDERSTAKYIVDSATVPASPVRKNDLVLALRRVT